MALAHFPLYPADFEADTSHLTLAEDGAYNRLLRLMWMTPGCSLPADHRWLQRRLRATPEEFSEIVAPLLEEFFKVERGRIFSPRLTKIYAEVSALHSARSAAGKKGGSAKAIENKGKEVKPGFDFAKAELKQPKPKPNIEKRDTDVSQKKTPQRGTRLSENWTLPRSWGEWALQEGATEAEVRSEAERFRDFWIGKSGKDATKMDWLATWRNWIRNRKGPKGGTQNGKQHQLGFDATVREVAQQLASGSIRLEADPGDPFA